MGWGPTTCLTGDFGDSLRRMASAAVGASLVLGSLIRNADESGADESSFYDERPESRPIVRTAIQAPSASRLQTLDLALDLRLRGRPIEVGAKTRDRDENGADERDPNDPRIPVAGVPRSRAQVLGFRKSRCSSWQGLCALPVSITLSGWRRPRYCRSQ